MGMTMYKEVFSHMIGYLVERIQSNYALQLIPNSFLSSSSTSSAFASILLTFLLKVSDRLRCVLFLFCPCVFCKHLLVSDLTSMAAVLCFLLVLSLSLLASLSVLPCSLHLSHAPLPLHLPVYLTPSLSLCLCVFISPILFLHSFILFHSCLQCVHPLISLHLSISLCWCISSSLPSSCTPFVNPPPSQRMDTMGDNMEQSNLYLKLFKLVFGSVTLFALENEVMLRVSGYSCHRQPWLSEKVVAQ